MENILLEKALPTPPSPESGRIHEVAEVVEVEMHTPMIRPGLKFRYGRELQADRAPRRNRLEYVALLFSFLFLALERFLRIITLALPAPIINFFYTNSRILFNAFSPKRHTTVDSSRKEKSIVAKVRDADGFVDLCELWNDGSWRVEEHVVQTKDGYLLGLHRIVKKNDFNRSRSHSRVGSGRVEATRGNGGKKVVYLHHGLLMNSEVWVCQTEKERCLPFVLADLGYDVWLGNNRGNKYSKKSIHHPSTSQEFWQFSMDDFAFYDIPDSISYILDTTRQPSLSYIGFSQGTAQAFATLSIHPKLNEKVDVFIALAPAMSPAGLSNSIVDALMKASPNLMYLFFGRKSILSSTTFWQSILYPPIFVRVIDMALDFLFKWRGDNISLNQKIAAYAHLYSYTSVKSVVHWFQIIRNGCFQMYDDDLGGITAFTSRSHTKVAKFPTRNITTPIVLVYGGQDSLVDIDVMLKELPSHTTATEIPHYEHLDFLWGEDVQKLVFPRVLNALDRFSNTTLEDFHLVSIPPSSSANQMSEDDLKHIEASLEAQVQARLAANMGASYSEDETVINSSPTSELRATADLERPNTSSPPPQVALPLTRSVSQILHAPSPLTQTTLPEEDEPALTLPAAPPRRASVQVLEPEGVPIDYHQHHNSLPLSPNEQPLLENEGSLSESAHAELDDFLQGGATEAPAPEPVEERSPPTGPRIPTAMSPRGGAKRRRGGSGGRGRGRGMVTGASWQGRNRSVDYDLGQRGSSIDYSMQQRGYGGGGGGWNEYGDAAGMGWMA